MRAVGEYAAANGAVASASEASALVAAFFRKLEDLDLLLYRAVKDGSGDAGGAGAALDAAEAEARLGAAADALAALLATVPADVLERARAVLGKAGDAPAAAAGAAAAAAAASAAAAAAPDAAAAAAGGAAAPAAPSPEDVELLNELLTIWE